MKKPASNFPNDQPIATLKRRQLATSQKRTSKKTKVASSKQLQPLADAATEVSFPLISQLYSIPVHQLTFDFSGCGPRICC
jgi:hypothetical protein